MASFPPPLSPSPPKMSRTSKPLGSPPHTFDDGSSSTFPLGAAVLGSIAIFVLIFVICVIKKKNKNKKKKWQHVQMQYQGETSGGRKADNVSNNSESGLISGELRSNFPETSSSSQNICLGLQKRTFKYEQLAAATNGFTEDNKLGEGGFGSVYKGVLTDGTLVAVKTLNAGSKQGEREFQAEIDTISHIHHRNLLSLVGYCIAGGHRMLVYQFVPNRTLEYHLYVNLDVTLDWSKRFTIALGSATGLAYLHAYCQPRIIHRDIKAANILLDNNYDPLVADFGLAKLLDDSKTHVTTRIMGTFGYLAPEYGLKGEITEKSDVFSFGVVLLQLISGRRPVDRRNKYESLVDWARPLLTSALEDENYTALADPRLGIAYEHNEMRRMIACADASIRQFPAARPEMSQILHVLEGLVSVEQLIAETDANDNATLRSESYSEVLQKFRKMVLENTGGESLNTGDWTLDSSSLSSRDKTPDDGASSSIVCRSIV